MSKSVVKGEEISVLVEQAFPTCILVSFQQGEKTFRGVLLDESSQTGVVRASSSDVLAGQADSPANLGLTTARSTTFQSSEDHSPTSRVSTRSSAMMSKDSNASRSGEMTPVHKIRGLVESLKPRARRQSPVSQPSHMNSLTSSPQLEQNVPGKSQSSKQNEDGSNITKALKRKRIQDLADSEGAICEPTKKTNKETIGSGNSHTQIMSEEERPAVNTKPSLPLSLSRHSTLFPVLKLKKTDKKDNRYVAVTVYNSHKGSLNEQCSAVGNVDATEVSKSLSRKDASAHKHNTRFKARKGAGNSWSLSMSGVKSVEKSISVQEEDKGSLVQVITAIPAERPPGITMDTLSKGKNYSNEKPRGSCKVRRQLAPKNAHSSEHMKVGDIVWGKVHGHPWWPGRILGILCHASESDGGCEVVKVSWYGSTTTSDISCSLLVKFGENFKHFFKKQKKGAYRLAVRQAKEDLENSMNGTLVMSV